MGYRRFPRAFHMPIWESTDRMEETVFLAQLAYIVGSARVTVGVLQERDTSFKDFSFFEIVPASNEGKVKE